MKPGGGSPAASPESESATGLPGPPLPWASPADVRLCGHLRKQKSRRRRFFVLRNDPPRLECYESEKKFRGGEARPKLSVSLAGACTISKRVDARRRLLIVLYTRDRCLGVAAASEAEQQAWYSALLEVRAAAAGPSSHEDPGTWLLAPFQDVWPVTLRPKGLGRARGLGSGGYRLCLGSGILSLLRKPRRRDSEDAGASPPPPALRLSLLSVRRCGHADAFFFLELGRSAPTGPGELWLQAPDAVVAQSIHETVLAAMKRLGDGGTGGRAEPRDPPTSASRPSVPPPCETLTSARPSGLTREECVGESKPATLQPRSTPGAAASYSEGLEGAGGYISMGAQSDYEPMGGGQAGGYMVMAPPSLRLVAANATPHQLLQEWGATEYVPMSRFPPESFSSSSLPPSSKRGAGKSGPCPKDKWGQAETQPCLQLRSELAGEYVSIEYTAPNCVGMGTAKPVPPDGRLNYIDLELVPPLEARCDTPGNSRLSYARIKFQNFREAKSSYSISAESQMGIGPHPASNDASTWTHPTPHPHLQYLPCEDKESKQLFTLGLNSWYSSARGMKAPILPLVSPQSGVTPPTPCSASPDASHRLTQPFSLADN